MTWSAGESDLLGRLPVGTDMVPGATVIPVGGNWREPAIVTTSYVELILDYRLAE